MTRLSAAPGVHCHAGAWALLLAVLTLGDGPAFAAPEAQRRIAPPDAVTCPRDHLTVHEGRVITYQRRSDRTLLRIRTDAATIEAVTLAHPGTRDPSPWFLMERAPFGAADWSRIERAPGRLRPGLRVAAWVCSTGAATLIDWQLPRSP
jgi:hypothetical protein